MKSFNKDIGLDLADNYIRYEKIVVQQVICELRLHYDLLGQIVWSKFFVRSDVYFQKQCTQTFSFVHI